MAAMDENDDGKGQRSALRIIVCAAALALLHIGSGNARRASMAAEIAASDTFIQMQGKVLRETLMLSAANMPGLDRDVRAAELGEATRLRQPNPAGQGIDQLAASARALRQQAQVAAAASETYALGEAALLLAILLLTVALLRPSRWLARGAGLMAAAGIFAGLWAMLA